MPNRLQSPLHLIWFSHISWSWNGFRVRVSLPFIIPYQPSLTNRFPHPFPPHHFLATRCLTIMHPFLLSSVMAIPECWICQTTNNPTMVQNSLMLRHLIFDFPMSFRMSDRVCKQINRACEWSKQCEAGSMKHANEWANEKTDEQVAQYLRRDSWLF